jgi:phosphopentomutase
VLVCGAGINSGALGKRETFADIGQGLASFFELSPMDYGTRFL